jgi:hypothetical protein
MNLPGDVQVLLKDIITQGYQFQEGFLTNFEIKRLDIDNAGVL